MVGLVEIAVDSGLEVDDRKTPRFKRRLVSVR